MDLRRLSEGSDDPNLKSSIALLLAKSEIDKGNYDLSVQLLRSIKEDVKQSQQWIQFAVGSEKCRVSLLRTGNEKHASQVIVHCWNVIRRSLKTLKKCTSSEGCSEVTALWLSRFVQSLEPFEGSSIVNHSLESVEMPDMTSIVQSTYYKQLQACHEFEEKIRSCTASNSVLLHGSVTGIASNMFCSLETIQSHASGPD